MPSAQDYHVNPHFHMGDREGEHQQPPMAPATPRMMGRRVSESSAPGLMPAANIVNDTTQQPQQQPQLQTVPQSVPVPAQSFNDVVSNKPFHRKSLGDWDFLETVGAGSMGKVKLAKHRLTNEVCAIKIVNRAAKSYMHKQNQLPPPKTEEELMERKKKLEKELSRDRRTIREASLGQILYHPHICRLFEMCTMSNHFYMLFEYVSGGQLLDYIIQHGSLRERHARKFVRGIASALQYLHLNNIVHRDLKIENIMISTSGEIKIIDFGLSNLYDNKKQLHTFCGSLYFAAPELLKANPYIGPEVDIWSFGVVIYVLVCGKVPFDDENASVLHEKIKKGKVEYPQHLSIECISLLSKMLVVDPLKRASLKQVCNHQWMQRGFDFPPPSYIPHRVPLTVEMLDVNVIKEMHRLELVNDVNDALQALRDIIDSHEYKELSREYWYNVQNSNNQEDGTRAFHPLLSIYYLVDEMLKRKLAKRLQKQQQLQQQQQQQLQAGYQSKPFQGQSQPIFPSDQVDTSIPLPDQSQPKTLQQPVSVNNSDYIVRPSSIKEVSPEHTTSPAAYIPSNLERNSTVVASPVRNKELPQIMIPPKLAIPELAHTSPTRKSSDANPELDAVMSPSPAPMDYPSQQEQTKQQQANKYNMGSVKTSTTSSEKPKIGSIFRRLSQRHRHAQTINQGSLQVQEPKSVALQTNAAPKVRKTHTRTVSEHVPSTSRYADPYYSENAPRDMQGDLPALPANADVLVKQQQERLNDLKLNNELDDESETQSTKYDENQPLALLSLPKGKKLHPSARAKSVGHARRESLKYNRPPVLTTSAANTSSDGSTAPGRINTNDDGFLQSSSEGNALQIDDISPWEELTDEQIIERASKAPPGSMPSIDFPRSLFLKGFFSVQTTSSKPLPVVRYKIISTLKKLNIEFTEVKGGFICCHRQSYVSQEQPPNHGRHPSIVINETSSLESNSSTANSHRKQLSIPSRHGSIRRHGSLKQPGIPATPLAAATHERNLSVTSPRTSTGQILEEVSTASFETLNNQEDILTNSKAQDMNKVVIGNKNEAGNKERPPLKFEIHIVKVKLVGLAGVHFKKVSGNTWMYKELATHILKELNL
ncbi:serine/threonine protein kinase KIN2 [Kluyveromyces lactis]|uniref:non-specific serine/threonine protein kinase n=1 Tax=Kluyveromyces lactis (strain ATCC 8585 / CBS 2359 / DSM 70799 / NBRC 1267 / NRRL Y-1140 / WM37) TaxID=284590 RepID=Q6CJD2_KLULA|nr:uncharacterized protein KLLA0_F19536g [Kluyveromyces lactis]CAG98665.1 KLLA0F19536p [Kluyveromyces lactis]|eukprot:XP_455957.1 uncharacterized protein KLLA0_F19536g [Kluyveromyces lactis]